MLQNREAHRAALSDRPVTVFPRADCQLNLLMLPAFGQAAETTPSAAEVPEKAQLSNACTPCGDSSCSQPAPVHYCHRQAAIKGWDAFILGY